LAEIWGDTKSPQAHPPIWANDFGMRKNRTVKMFPTPDLKLWTRLCLNHDVTTVSPWRS